MLVEHAFASPPSKETLQAARRLLETGGYKVRHADDRELLVWRGEKKPRLWSSVLELPQVLMIKGVERRMEVAAHIEPYRSAGKTHEQLLCALTASLEAYLYRDVSLEDAKRPLVALEQQIRKEDEYRRTGAIVLAIGGALLIAGLFVGAWAMSR